MLMIFRVRPTDEVSDPALCPSQFSSEILTRDGKRHFNCIGQRTIDSFVGRSQWRTQLCRPSASLQSSSGMLRCECVVAPGQSSGTATQGNLRWSPIVRSLLCEGRSSPLCSPSALLPGSEAPPLRVSPFRLECRTHCHSHPETTGQLAFRVLGPRPISPTAGFS